MSVNLDRPKLSVPLSERDHIQGNPDIAQVTLVEYGDFECPYCGAAYPVVKRIQNHMGNQLLFAFRHFPISSSHPHAFQAAEASESAAAQGEFWEMHDMLYEHQQHLESEDLFAYAEQLGLDIDQFERDLVDHTFESAVREDFRSGVRSGVNGTPTFFINGLRHNGGYDYKSLLNELIAAENEK